MYNSEDDNELDRLSREAASEYKAPGNADWQTMLVELDKALPQEKKKRRFLFFWWLLPALVAGSFMLWRFYPQLDMVAPAQVAISVPAVDKVAEVPSTAPSETTVAVIKEAAIAQKEIPGAPIKLADTHTALQTEDNTVAKTIVDNPVTPPSSTSTNIALRPTQEITVADPIIATEKTDTPEKNVPAEAKDTTATTPAEEAAMKIIVKKQNKGSWSISVLGGLDKSTVKYRYGYDPGYNAGFMFGYHFNERFSIHTGAVYTQKNYKMAGSDFTAPKGSFPSYYNLETVEGYCRMWDVPLLVRYNIRHSEKANIFLSTGLSSYFMTKENYTYEYYNLSGQLTSRNAAYNSTDTHVFSILHLSAGFENRVGRNLFLQVEPYAKLPLGGVGFGNIELSSFGVNLSLQFRQPSKK